ncbi:MAG: hypothetical protein IT447_12060 [Phycisphaerales bacterium]|jgi:hypothetical protein|nr:hypothetical protein [Phycisphaerales bacterium]
MKITSISIITIAIALIIVAVMLLPSFRHTPDVANPIVCASNLRQLGQAMLFYAQGNKGKYPPDFGTLLLTQEVTIDEFVCPSSGTLVPGNLKSKEEMAKWVNEYSDYVYAGAGLDNMSTPEQILIYEKLRDHHRGRVCLCYGDGHVEFQSLPEAKHQIILASKTNPNLPKDGGL